MFSLVRSLFQVADRSILQVSIKRSIFQSSGFCLHNNEILNANAAKNFKFTTSTSFLNNNAGMFSTRQHSKSFSTSRIVNKWLSQNVSLNTSLLQSTRFGDVHSRLAQRSMLHPLPEITSTQKRSVIIYSEEDGQKKSVQAVLDRFRRLGNGLWLRMQSGRNRAIWKKLKRRGKRWKVYRLKKAVFCNKQQSKMLDKMVTDNWKTQKWYVEDPYKGYTKETHFYYHPKDLPWNSTKELPDHYKYAINRYKKGNQLRKNRRIEHEKITNSYRQKPLPSTKNGFFFA